MTRKVQTTKEKTQLDFFKIKYFCTSKETINKMKKITHRMQLIFASHISAKGFISRTYFFKEVMQIARRHMKRCSTSPVIMEVKIKTTGAASQLLAWLPYTDSGVSCQDVEKWSPHALWMGRTTVHCCRHCTSLNKWTPDYVTQRFHTSCATPKKWNQGLALISTATSFPRSIVHRCWGGNSPCS